MARLLNISEAASIAIHSMAIIAVSDGIVTSKQIGNKTNFSVNHISKVLQLLSKHGFLDSGRGPKGGFKLSKKAHEINLLDIYQMIEGNLEDIQCIHNNVSCEFQECVFGNVHQKLTSQFKDYFSKRTLNDIILKK